MFQRLFERCAAEAKCAQAYPQLEQAFYQVMDELDAHPVKVGNTLVTGARFIDLIGALLMDSYEIRQLPDLIYETHQGKHALLDSKVRQIFTYDDYFADGLQYSINCADEVAFISPDAVATGASSVNAHFARYFDELAQIDFGICSFWGARPALPIESAPVVSDVPTLVLVGDTDPFTPPTWAKLTAATLSQSQIAEFPGLGHGVFRADFMTKYCVSHLVGDFLDHPASKLDMKCLDTFRTTPIGFG